MEFKSIDEQNCSDKFRNIVDAMRMRDVRRFNQAKSEFRVALEQASPGVTEKYRPLFDAVP